MLHSWRDCKPVFLNGRAVAQYRALASVIPGRERPEETMLQDLISPVGN